MTSFDCLFVLFKIHTKKFKCSFFNHHITRTHNHTHH